VFRTFHDQQLGVDCEFVPSADGADQRCVPTSQVTVVYSDTACSEAVAWKVQASDFKEGDLVSGAFPGVPSNCAGQSLPNRAAYRVGPKLSDETLPTPDAGPYEVRAGECQHAYPPAKLTPATYSLVPIADSELARGRLVSVRITDSLRLTRLIADDGAELSLHATDNLGDPCEFQRDGECVPEPIARPASVAVPGRFWSALSSDCSVPAFQGPYTADCGDSKFGIGDDAAGQPRIYTVEPTNAAFSWTYMELPSPDNWTYSCMPASSDITGLMAPSRDVTGTLPSVGQQRTGQGVLHVDYYSSAGSQLLPVQVDPSQASPGVVPRAAFVNDAGNPCQIMSADDGTERCVFRDQSGVVVGDLATSPEVVWGPL
jgi:hypothetical protein